MPEASQNLMNVSARRYQRASVLLLLTLQIGLSLYMMSPALTGRMFSKNDLARYAIPARQFYSKCLQDGDSFTWWPHIWCGFFLHADDFVGLYHPWHYIVYRVFPFFAAFDLEMTTNYVAILFGMTALLRRWRLGPVASLFGASLFAFTGFNVCHFVHISLTPGAAHLPLLLLMTHEVTRSRRRLLRWFAAIGIATLVTSAILICHPQILWMCAIIGVGYIVTVARSFVNLVRSFGLLLLALTLGLGGAALQIVPTYELMLRSQRAQLTQRLLAEGSLPACNWLLQPLSPYIYRAGVIIDSDISFSHVKLTPAGTLSDWVAWEYAVYPGAAVTPLLVWLLVRWRHSRRWRGLAVLMLVLVGIGVTLSLGDNFPTFPYTSKLPIFKMFRDPCRYIFIPSFALSVLAAIAVASLSRLATQANVDPSGGAWAVLGVGALSLAGTLSLCVLGPVHRNLLVPEGMSSPAFAMAGATLVALSSVAVFLAARQRRYAITLLSLITVVDILLYAGRQYSDSTISNLFEVAASSIVPPPPLVPASIRDAEYDCRVSYGNTLSDESLALVGLKFTDGYTSFLVNRRLNYRSEVAMRLTGTYVRRVPTSHGDDWIYIHDPMPRVRLVDHAVVSHDPASDARQIDIRRVALVDEAVDLPGGVPGHATLTSDRPGNITVETVASSRQMLVLSESYWNGWTATIDGVKRRAIPVYGDFIGCVVEPGAHEVIFRFEPDSLRRGQLISAVAGVIALIWLGFCAYLQWRERAAASAVPLRIEPQRKKSSTSEARSARLTRSRGK